MRDRINANRVALVDALESRAHPRRLVRHRHAARHVRAPRPHGRQVARLKDEHGVYVVGKGRINVAGFTSANLDPFADALAEVLATA